MEDYGSKSYKNTPHVHDRQIVNYDPNQSSTYDQTQHTQVGYYNDSSKKGSFPTGSSSSSSSSKKNWVFSDPEFQRKKRVAGYKVYAVEGRMKGTFNKSFRWLKDKYSHVRYGWF